MSDERLHREAVNHPPYYGGDTMYETIKVIEAWGLGFCLGNAVKYISRAGKKDTATRAEDLKKAAWYLAREIPGLVGDRSDDGDPATEEWVESSERWCRYQPCPDSIPSYQHRAGTAAVYFYPRERVLEIPGLAWRLPNPTRGQVRQVIAALSLNSSPPG